MPLTTIKRRYLDRCRRHAEGFCHPQVNHHSFRVVTCKWPYLSSCDRDYDKVLKTRLVIPGAKSLHELAIFLHEVGHFLLNHSVEEAIDPPGKHWPEKYRHLHTRDRESEIQEELEANRYVAREWQQLGLDLEDAYFALCHGFHSHVVKATKPYEQGFFDLHHKMDELFSVKRRGQSFVWS